MPSPTGADKSTFGASACRDWNDSRLPRGALRIAGGFNSGMDGGVSVPENEECSVGSACTGAVIGATPASCSAGTFGAVIGATVTGAATGGGAGGGTKIGRAH